MAEQIQVELIYALPDKQRLLSFSVEEGVTVKGAVEQSGVLEQYPELDIETMKVGLFGKLTKMTQIMRERDRVEIYRPLIADPKEVRKRKAAEGKKFKKGGESNKDNSDSKKTLSKDK
jgi:putative ubiquitin-RnfH superfamily antitoxin RatB of RatAB toxin-antitoxin module